MNIPKTKKEKAAVETAKSVMEDDRPAPVISDEDKSAIFLEHEGRWISANYSTALSMDMPDEDFDFVEFSED